MEIKARVADLLILTQILDEFEDFMFNFEEFMNKYGKIKSPSRYDMELVHKISDASLDESSSVIFLNKYHKFYEENSHVLKTINENTSLLEFIYFNYKNEDYNIYDFYIYMKKHRDKLDKITLILNRFKDLGMKIVALDKDYDFTSGVWSFDYYNYTYRIYNHCAYLENMQIIPTYYNDTIHYTTTNSNYLIDDQDSSTAHIIKVKDLMLDPKTLPKNRQEMYDKMLDLLDKNIETYQTLREAVDFNVSVKDLNDKFEDTLKRASELGFISDKKELINCLTNIKENLEQIDIINGRYKQRVVGSNYLISGDNIEEETQKIRNYRYVDYD